MTWNRVYGLTMAVLIVSTLVGVGIMSRRIFLAPPVSASTVYFYIAVGGLPALIAFLIGARARPTGKRIMLVALPVYAIMILVIYLALIGPGLYTDIQCQAPSGSGFANRLDCSCSIETIEGSTASKCSADALVPLPLIRLVEEKRGPP